MIQRIKSNHRAAQVVKHNNTMYLTGLVTSDVELDVKGQTQDILDRMVTILEENGSAKDKVLSVQIFVKSMSDFAAMNEVYDAFFAEDEKPTRSCLEANMARETLLVELVVIAAY